jgi:hypothetical protein
MTDTIPWWQSRTIWGGVAAVVAPMIGLTDISAVTDTAMDVVGAIGGVVAIYGRAVATRSVR